MNRMEEECKKEKYKPKFQSYIRCTYCNVFGRKENYFIDEWGAHCSRVERLMTIKLRRVY